MKWCKWYQPLKRCHHTAPGSLHVAPGRVAWACSVCGERDADGRPGGAIMFMFMVMVITILISITIMAMVILYY